MPAWMKRLALAPGSARGCRGGRWESRIRTIWSRILRLGSSGRCARRPRPLQRGSPAAGETTRERELAVTVTAGAPSTSLCQYAATPVRRHTLTGSRCLTTLGSTPCAGQLPGESGGWRSPDRNPRRAGHDAKWVYLLAAGAGVLFVVLRRAIHRDQWLVFQQWHVYHRCGT